MKFEQYLQEEYITTLGTVKNPYEVYQNPTATDFEEMKKNMRKGGSNTNFHVRFIIDTNKRNIFVWDGEKSVHWNVEHYLQSNQIISRNIEEDYGSIVKNKIRSPNFAISINKWPNLSWLKKYFITEEDIKEEYAAVHEKEPWNKNGSDNEIYVNPTAKEINQVSNNKGKYVRYIADFKQQKLFVFTSEMIHADALDVLKKEKLVKFSYYDDMKQMANWYSMGTAKVSGGKLVFYRSDTGFAWRETITKWNWPKKDDSWLNPWFGPGYIKRFIEVSTDVDNDPEWR
jgi:hypothetical protein